MYHKLKRNYDKFYAEGGWTYHPDRESAALDRNIITPLGLRKGSRLLDFGCGMGLFSHLFHEFGFAVTGIDRSEAGIAHAREKYPGPAFLAADADHVFEHFGPGSLDVIFVRGMSWYHYELNGVNKHGVDVPAKTRDLFELLAPGGSFILQIKTDFTGTRPDIGVYHCKVDEFRELFARFGDIKLLTDWQGTPLETNRDGEASGKNIIIATGKS